MHAGLTVVHASCCFCTAYDTRAGSHCIWQNGSGIVKQKAEGMYNNTHWPGLGGGNVHRPYSDSRLLHDFSSAGFLNSFHLLDEATQAGEHACMAYCLGSAQKHHRPINRLDQHDCLHTHTANSVSQSKEAHVYLRQGSETMACATIHALFSDEICSNRKPCMSVVARQLTTGNGKRLNKRTRLAG